MLKTETNTQAMERKVRAAARAVLGTFAMASDFEHGQWWVRNLDTGAAWSVVDGTGPDTSGGFGFETIAHGEEE